MTKGDPTRSAQSVADPLKSTPTYIEEEFGTVRLDDVLVLVIGDRDDLVPTAVSELDGRKPERGIGSKD